MKKRFCISDFGVAFSTRARGAEISDNISNILASIQDNDTLVIDFSGVEALSYSFVDELFYRVIEASQLRNNVKKHILVTNWADELLTVLDQTLHRRNCVLTPSAYSHKNNMKEGTLTSSIVKT